MWPYLTAALTFCSLASAQAPPSFSNGTNPAEWLYRHPGSRQPLVLFGERHSGTNYLQTILELNFDVEVTFDYGWKHWWMWEQTQRKKFLTEDQNMPVVIIFRNPIAWLLGMFKEPHHSKPPRTSLPAWVQQEEFLSWCFPEGWRPNRPISERRSDGQIICDNVTGGILSLRALKIRQMKDVENYHRRVFFLRYEDFQADPRGWTQRLGNDLQLPWKHLDPATKQPLVKETAERILPGMKDSHKHMDHKRVARLDSEIDRKFTQVVGCSKTIICRRLDLNAEILAGYSPRVLWNICT